MEINTKRNVNPEMAMKILKREGIEINIDCAKLILDLMYKFSILAVNQIRLVPSRMINTLACLII